MIQNHPRFSTRKVKETGDIFYGSAAKFGKKLNRMQAVLLVFPNFSNYRNEVTYSLLSADTFGMVLS